MNKPQLTSDGQEDGVQDLVRREGGAARVDRARAAHRGLEAARAVQEQAGMRVGVRRGVS